MQRACELILKDRTDDRGRKDRTQLLDRAEDARGRPRETRLQRARSEVEERCPHAGHAEARNDESREQGPAIAVGAHGVRDPALAGDEEQETEEEDALRIALLD